MKTPINKKLNSRNTKKEIYDAYKELYETFENNDISLVKKLIAKYDPRTGPRKHRVFVALKSLLSALKKYS